MLYPNNTTKQIVSREIERKIKLLEEANERNASEISSVEGTVNSLGDRTLAAEEDIADIKGAVETINGEIDNINDALEEKQDKLNLLDTVESDSNSPVKSKGIYNALTEKIDTNKIKDNPDPHGEDVLSTGGAYDIVQDLTEQTTTKVNEAKAEINEDINDINDDIGTINEQIEDIYVRLQQGGFWVFDNVPTQNSDNPVKSNGIYEAIRQILINLQNRIETQHFSSPVIQTDTIGTLNNGEVAIANPKLGGQSVEATALMSSNGIDNTGTIRTDTLKTGDINYEGTLRINGVTGLHLDSQSEIEIEAPLVHFKNTPVKFTHKEISIPARSAYALTCYKFNQDVIEEVYSSPFVAEEIMVIPRPLHNQSQTAVTIANGLPIVVYNKTELSVGVKIESNSAEYYIKVYLLNTTGNEIILHQMADSLDGYNSHSLIRDRETYYIVEPFPDINKLGNFDGNSYSDNLYIRLTQEVEYPSGIGCTFVHIKAEWENTLLKTLVSTATIPYPITGVKSVDVNSRTYGNVNEVSIYVNTDIDNPTSFDTVPLPFEDDLDIPSHYLSVFRLRKFPVKISVEGTRDLDNEVYSGFVWYNPSSNQWELYSTQTLSGNYTYEVSPITFIL